MNYFSYPEPPQYDRYAVIRGAWDDLVLDRCKAEIDWITNWREKGYGKRLCNTVLPPMIAQVIAETETAPFLYWLEKLTGEAVAPDPALNGGGVHSSLPGGYLRMHTDFNVLLSGPGGHPVAYRRLNLLLYLNRDWPADGGGELLLYGEKIAPEANTMVVFTTDPESWHGHPMPCTRRRDSIALYYYGTKEPDGFRQQTVTVYRDG